MDVIYPLSASSARGDIFRWSLASVRRNVAHDRVLVAGAAPRRVTGIEHVQGVDFSHDRAKNVQRKVLDALDVCGPDVMVISDDVIVLRPLEVEGLHWCGTLADRVEAALVSRPVGDGWRKAIEATHATCWGLGFDDAKDCGSHWPQRFDRDKLRDVLRMCLDLPVGVDYATVYGSIHGGVMRRVPQAKWPQWHAPLLCDRVVSTHPRWEDDIAFRSWAGRTLGR